MSDTPEKLAYHLWEELDTEGLVSVGVESFRDVAQKLPQKLDIPGAAIRRALEAFLAKGELDT